jgi:hypothetical protein
MDCGCGPVLVGSCPSKKVLSACVCVCVCVWLINDARQTRHARFVLLIEVWRVGH